MSTPATDPDLADLKDSGTTITHRGTTYQVLTTTHPDADSPYVLRSRKGIHYMLLRNVPKPHQMFGVAWDTTRVLPGWFSDKDGTLKSIN